MLRMDALLLSLILCALVEGAGNTARRYVGLVARFGHDGTGWVTAGMVAACAANALIAALAGLWIAPMLTPEARALFLAAGLMMAGGGLLFVSRRFDSMEGGATVRAPLLIVLVTLFITGISGSAPLLIAAIAVYFADPWMAGIGGALGSVAGCFAGSVAKEVVWIRAGRFGIGALLMLGAFGMAMDALRLI